jgi:DNA-directed RNA polymerase subunit M/transcription elongation factor TFIIS
MMSIKADYVSVEKDEFEGLTTIEHLRHCRHRGGSNELTLSWRRNIRPTSDRMILDLEIKTSRSGGWLPSQLVILADDQRIELKYFPSKVCDYRGGDLFEVGMFFLDPAPGTLRTLCDAASLKLKIHSVEKNEYTLLPEEFCTQLQLQARQFYNNAFDQTMYIDAVTGTAARTENDTFASQIAQRETRYRSLCNHRLIWGLVWGGIFGGLCLIPVVWKVSFSSSESDLAIMAGLLSSLSWLVPHVQILWIERQKNKECPRCHHRAIKLTGYREDIYQVRSVEQIVNDRLTGNRKSRQVTVTDHEVTQDFACMDCRHKWTRSHIARGF